MKNHPVFFTIITVCYNANEKLNQTIESVLNQSLDDYEYIVVDGGSKDGTVASLSKWEGCFWGKMSWVSEKDNGIYDAMNKGLRKAKGQYIVFINADDLLCANVLEIVKEKAIEYKYPDIIYGDSINIYSNQGENIKKNIASLDHIDTKTLNSGMGVVHQAMFTKAELFNQVGTFDNQYSIGADWDFLIRCVKHGADLCHIHVPICEFSTDGVSSRVHNLQRHKIRKKNKLYHIVDFGLIKDAFSIKTMIQLLIGEQRYQKLRYSYNRRKLR